MNFLEHLKQSKEIREQFSDWYGEETDIDVIEFALHEHLITESELDLLESDMGQFEYPILFEDTEYKNANSLLAALKNKHF